MSRVGWLAIVLLVLWPAAWAAAQPAAGAPSGGALGSHPSVAQAQALLDSGRYAEARARLLEASQQSRSDPSAHAHVLMALATFHERYVGDTRGVGRYLRELEQLRLASEQAPMPQARALRARLRAEATEYAAENAVVARASAYEQDEAALRQRAAELSTLVERRPSYPGLALAWHYLGQSRLLLGEYRAAYRAFRRARELRPALEFALPTPRLQAEALEKWVRRDLGRASQVGLATFLLLGAGCLVWLRPWRWLALRHLLAFGLLLGAWTFCFPLLVRLLGPTLPHDLSAFPSPIHVESAMGTPLSGPLDSLYWHGLAGVTGAFVVALVASRLRWRWTSLTTAGTATLLLFACLMTKFVLEQSMASYRPADDGGYRLLRGAFFYPVSSGQEPFMLTDPLRFCDFQLALDNMDEAEPKSWFRRYAPRCRAP